MDIEMVTISKEEYDELISDRIFLQCLIESGVDSWEGYDYAREVFSNYE